MCIFSRWKSFFGLLCTLLATCNLLAQEEPLFDKTGTHSGLFFLKPAEDERLQQYTYNKIYQARNGKLYFGTNSGLVCYDGINVRTYSHIDGDTNSLTQNSIIDIVEDKKGNLYLSTLSGGINYLDLRTGKATHLPISFNGPNVLIELQGRELLKANLYLDADENLWCGASNYDLYFYNPRSKRYRQIQFDSIEWRPFIVSDIKQDPKNKDVLWLATNIGICSVNRKTFSITKNFKCANDSDPLSDKIPVKNLDVREDGIIWYGTNGSGMGRYDINSGLYNIFKSAPNTSPTKNIYISSLFKRNDNEYYVTLGNGSVFIYNILTKKYYPLPNLFLPKAFKESKDIIVDSYKNIWCIINGRLFVSYSEKNLFKTITIKDKINNNDSIPNEIKNITWDPVKKQYYAALKNRDEGVFIFNDSLKLLRSIPVPPRSYPEVNGTINIAIDSRNRLWGCGDLLSVYDSGKQKMVVSFLKYPSLGNLWPGFQHNRSCLDILSDKETIYTVNGDSCFFIDANNLTYRSISFPLINGPSGYGYGFKLRFDKTNKYLYAGNYLYDSGKSVIFQYDLNARSFKKIIVPSSVKVPIVYADLSWYELDDSGNIWIGTSQSVIVYEPRTFKRIHSYEKKNGNVIKQLINIKDKGVMCIMGENGIELYDYINDRSTYISISDGLYINSFQMSGYANNTLFISYPGYLQYVPIDSFLYKKENRVCYLSGFTVEGKENHLSLEPDFLEHITLNHDQHDITLTVSTTEFYNPQRLQYRYMLEGADNDWSYSNFENRSISYRNLKPRAYTYRAAIKNSNGTWSKNELKLTIIIKPAFYETSWFMVLCIAIILGLAYFFYRRRIRSIRMEEQKRSKHEKELIELEAKALRAQMNPHFIFNCLNSIKSLIQQHDEERSVAYLTTFSKLIRNLFNNADKKEISLYDEIESCKLYLQLEAMRFDTKFSYTINVDNDIDLKSIQVPALIIQPFIENAIWHGIVPRNSAGQVSLNVLRKDEVVEIIIDDNGIGREASQQNKFASGKTHQSKGVNLTQSRLKLNNLLQQRQAELEIIDKKDEKGIATGTTVIIKIKEELS